MQGTNKKEISGEKEGHGTEIVFFVKKNVWSSCFQDSFFGTRQFNKREERNNNNQIKNSNTTREAQCFSLSILPFPRVHEERERERERERDYHHQQLRSRWQDTSFQSTRSLSLSLFSSCPSLRWMRHTTTTERPMGEEKMGTVSIERDNNLTRSRNQEGARKTRANGELTNTSVIITRHLSLSSFLFATHTLSHAFTHKMGIEREREKETNIFYLFLFEIVCTDTKHSLMSLKNKEPDSQPNKTRGGHEKKSYWYIYIFLF